MKDTTLETYRQRLLVVLMHINGHLEEDLGLDDLARISHFSPFHFHRIFRAMVGESVSQHVRRLRLELAAVRLKQTDTPIIELALSARYESHEAFTRAFKAMFGVAPSEFRSQRIGAPLAGVHPSPDTLGAPNTREADMLVKVVSLPPQKIAFVRHVGPYDEVGPTFDKLMEWAGPRGLFVPGVKVIGISYDDPSITPADKLRYDAAITLDPDDETKAEPEGEVGVRELAGGDYAVVCHQGPYSGLTETYDFLYGRWLPASGYDLTDAPPFEHYLNHPDSTDPEDLVTDVHIPLRI